MNRSFGPAAILSDNGTVQICCSTPSTYCYRYMGGACHDQNPPRQIENARNTPDWCRYKQQTKNDVEAARDFDRMGLTDMTRAELMKMMKDVPERFRVRYRDKLIPLNEHNAEMMRTAIRKMRLAAEAAA